MFLILKFSHSKPHSSITFDASPIYVGGGVLQRNGKVGSTCGKGYSLGRVTYLWLSLREALKKLKLRKIIDVDETKGKAQEQSGKNIFRGQTVGINVMHNRAIQFVPQLS